MLQVALLRNVLEQAAEGSEPLREALDDDPRSQLDQGDVNVNVPWMDPETPRLKQNRTEAAHVVQIAP